MTDTKLAEDPDGILVRWAAAVQNAGSVELVTSRSLPDALAARLEALIDVGQINAGDQLPPERDLAAIFGVSRASLREALNQLVLKGLIDRRPGRGTVVLDRSSKEKMSIHTLVRLGSDISEALDFRSVIEPAVAAHAARRRTRADLIRLEEVVRFMEDEDSLTSFARLDGQFHELIARACHNPLLVSLHEVAASWMATTRQEVLQTPMRRDVSRRGHNEIYRAIAAGDPDAAAAAMSRHIEDVTNLLREGRA